MVPCPVKTGMLGEMIGELTGKIVNQRVISHHGAGKIRIERTMETKGRLLGEDVTLLGTFWAKERPQGGMFSRGQGVVFTKSGEKAMVRGAGISVPAKGEGWSMRGSRYVQTKSPALKRLNEVVVVFEIEISPDGMVRDKWYEWK